MSDNDTQGNGAPWERYWNREDGRGSWAGNMARAASFNQAFAELTDVGTVDIGPIPAELVPEQWQRALVVGVDLERMGAYLVTAEGRTVFLVGPHTTEGPRGLQVAAGRVQVEGIDEAGAVVRLDLPSELIEAFVVISSHREQDGDND